MNRRIRISLAVLMLSIAATMTLVPDSHGAARKPRVQPGAGLSARPSGHAIVGPVTVEPSVAPIKWQFDGVDAPDSASAGFRDGVRSPRVSIDSTLRNRQSITRDELREIPVDVLGTTTVAPFPDPRDPSAEAGERQRLLNVPKEGGTTIAPLPAPDMAPRSSVRRRIGADSLRRWEPGKLRFRGSATTPVTPPRLLPGRAPEYPRSALDAGVQGHTLVRAHVRADGRVDDAELLSGDSRLGRSALDFVRRTRFEPGTIAGEPVDTWILMPLEFRLQ